MLRWAEVHLDRLLFNYKEVKKLAGRKGIYAVVKANAYGHGSVAVSKFLQERTDVYGFAVATYQEGQELFTSGIKRPILIMSSTVEEGREYLRELPLLPVVYDFKELSLVKELSVPFHVKIDTGMGRLGFLKSEWDDLISELKNSKVVGVMSHLCCADEDKEFSLSQAEEFKKFVKAVKAFKPKVEVHLENSAAVVLSLNSVLTHVRVGLSLYGSKPFKNYPADLKQVMEVKAKVLSVKELPLGHPVSYGGTYKAKGGERIGIVSFGYADGYPRELSNSGRVYLKGDFYPVRGRVCMDMLMVSVDKKVKKGDVATIFGSVNTFDEVAKSLGTIPYELMCRISQRVERVYIGL